MPIKIPQTLPAYNVLRQEGVMVMSEDAALRQDIRPLQIGLLNLMPKKVQTETQFARLIGSTPLQIELTLIRMTEHQSKNTSAAHLETFYRPFCEARERRFDGLIITGAPIEHLDFEAVSYWNEMREVFDWTQTHVHSTIGVCWGGMAMLHYFHGIPKHKLPAKACGCFRHRAIEPSATLLQGFSDSFVVPVSRWTEIRSEDVALHQELKILLRSDEVGPALIKDGKHRAYYMLNHLEYDSNTLKEEYERDATSGGPSVLPWDYFPDDDSTRAPENRWRSHGHLLYGNWINEIYQTTPFNLADLGREPSLLSSE